MKKVVRLTESDLVKIVKRVVKEQDKSPTPHNSFIPKGRNNPLTPKAPEGRNNPLWKKLVSTLQSLKYPPRVLTFDSYGRPSIPSQSLNWGTTAGDKGLYGFVISSTDSTSPKEQIQLFNTNNKGNQMDMHKWWQSKGYKTNGREIEIKFSDAEKLKENIALFFAKYPPMVNASPIRVKRVVKEEKEKETDLYTSLHSLRNSINDIKVASLLKDKKEALSKLEDILSTVRDMEDKNKSKRKVNENRDEEKDIFISGEFKGVRMEFGGKSSASPSDIIELYNAYVEEGIPLVKYLGRDIFLNANDDEIDKYSILDELNYAIVGEEDEEEEDYDDNNRQSFEDTGRHLGWFNPRRMNDM